MQKVKWGEYKLEDLFEIVGTKSLDSNAIDFSVNINNPTELDFWFKKYGQSSKHGVKVQLEFPSTNDPTYRQLKEKYGDLVTWVPGATGVHVHVEKL